MLFTAIDLRSFVARDCRWPAPVICRALPRSRRRAKQKYDATYGADRPALPSGIEEQAEFFFDCNELGTVYLRTYIDNDAFAGPPNAGHIAIADLLLVGGIQTAASTNVDTMIETAGMMLFGRIGAGIDGITVAALPPHRAPLLKIHGCWGIDPTTTVWTARQLLVEPIASRISSSETWLSVRLLDRDLVIVGYWTDWDYLNDVLARALGQVRPARVIVVDPSESATLAAKAPTLFALGQRATTAFLHVQTSGDIFLDRLRLSFSRSFVRRVLHSGRESFRETKGADPDAALTEAPVMDSTTLWQVRRDLEGCPPNEPARQRVPPEEPLLGLTILQLRARGAVAEGPFWPGWASRAGSAHSEPSDTSSRSSLRARNRASDRS